MLMMNYRGQQLGFHQKALTTVQVEDRGGSGGRGLAGWDSQSILKAEL